MNSLPSIPPGLWPVMLTPFHSDHRIDWAAFDELVDWYIDSGASGLFAVCLSSEMYQLSEDERLSLARRAVARSAGRVPVVVGGTFGSSVEAIAAFSQRLFGTGVSAVVCLTNQFCTESAGPARWQEGAERFLSLIDSAIPLGLYECPMPYKWLLSTSQTAWAARTGRFRFVKDTSCRIELIRARIEVARGTGLRLFNANTATLLESLRSGADGYSGIAANYMPQLYAWLCAHHASEPATAERVHRFLSVADALVSARYPAASKIFLGSCGLRISRHCRISEPAFAEEDLLALDALRGEAQSWCEKLGLPQLSRPHTASLQPS